MHDNLEETLLAILSHAQEAQALNALLSALEVRGEKVSRRTLQRMLAVLATEKKIIRIGKGRGTKYQALSFLNTRNDVLGESHYSDFVSLSEASQQIIKYLSKPLSIRKSVAYHRDFLEKYIPNKTTYLDIATREILWQLGNTGELSRPAGTYGKEILNKLLIDLSWASSKLEGNTYSRLDTKRLLEYGQSAEGKDAIETQMVLNHKDAIKYLIDDIGGIEINRYTFLNLHGLLSYGLLSDPDDCGRPRRKSVEIGGSVYRPIMIPQVIEECLNILLDKAAAIEDPFEQAFFLMVHLPYLQPFQDVNKRVSRIGLNIPLLKQNLCPLTFIDIPEKAYIDGVLGVYELNKTSLLKDVFVWAYERSAQEYIVMNKTLQPPDPLLVSNRKHIQILVHQVVKEANKDYLDKIVSYAETHLPIAERALFKAIVLDEIQRLHEGVLLRYGLTKADYKKWLTAIQ